MVRYQRYTVRTNASVEQRLDAECRCRRSQAALEYPRGQIVRGQQGFDLGAQLGVVRAAVAQPCAALVGVEVERMLEHVLDLDASCRRERHRAYASGSVVRDPRSASAW